MRIFGRDHHSAVITAEHLWDAANLRRYDWKSKQPRLQEDNAEWFSSRGQDEEPCVLVVA
jgi:hypothetical protein